MTQALYRRWRSQDFDELVGQGHVTQTLRNALRDDRVAHAYLFAGPRGTGKTSTARILAKALNCTAPQDKRPCNECPTCVAINEGRMIDLIEIDAASNNSVDDVRELREKVGFRPSEGRYKIYIVDEVHMLSGPAFNALLKTLEEPPPHARFILATTEPHKIPATVLSRCQRFDFRRIPASEIAGHLRHIVGEEGFQAEEEALMAIARSSQGCMRDAISLLDQMLSFGTQTVTLAQVQDALGAVSSQTVSEFVDALAGRDAPAALKLIRRLVLDGSSLTEFTGQVVEHLRGVMVLQMTQEAGLLSELPGDTVRSMQSQAQRMNLAATLFAVKRFGEAVTQLKGSGQPQLPLELALIEAIQGALIVAPPTGAPPVVVAAPAQPAVAAPPPKATPDKPTPQPTPQPAPQSAAPPPLDHAAAQKLQKQWKHFTAHVREQHGMQVWGALNSVRDMTVSADTVALAFGNNTFSRDIIARPDIHGKVAAMLSDFLGRPVQLECQTGEKAHLSHIVNPGPKTGDQEGDPLVDYAVNTLGARVVE
jgi:DNA polymerase-3 subunit gamma/tau